MIALFDTTFLFGEGSKIFVTFLFTLFVLQVVIKIIIIINNN